MLEITGKPFMGGSTRWKGVADCGMRITLKKTGHGMAEIHLNDMRLSGLVSYELREHTRNKTGITPTELTITLIASDVKFE